MRMVRRTGIRATAAMSATTCATYQITELSTTAMPATGRSAVPSVGEYM